MVLQRRMTPLMQLLCHAPKKSPTHHFCSICVRACTCSVMIDGDMMAAKLHSSGVQLDPYTIPGLEQV
jgi:hypothetical protein